MKPIAVTRFAAPPAALAPGVALAIALAGVAGDASAQDGHSMHDRHRGEGRETASAMPAVPDLGGEYAFATIAEIAALLRADPGTDWASVDLGALREHLRDMSRVTLDAEVAVEPTARGAVFTVTSGDPEVVASIRRMTGDHASTMGSMGNAPPWTFAASPVEGGARVEVEGADDGAAAMIRGLGFHGVVSDGNHHRIHHLMLATGAAPH